VKFWKKAVISKIELAALTIGLHKWSIELHQREVQAGLLFWAVVLKQLSYASKVKQFQLWY